MPYSSRYRKSQTRAFDERVAGGFEFLLPQQSTIVAASYAHDNEIVYQMDWGRGRTAVWASWTVF